MLETVFSRYYLAPALLTAVFLTLAGLALRYWMPEDDISEPSQTILISAATTLITYIVGIAVKLSHDAYKYSKLAGKYIGYAYKNEEDIRSSDFYRIKDESQSVATLKYLGDKDFSIKIDVTEHPERDDLTWSGDFRMTSDNTAMIAWWYTNKGLEYSVGHKRAVLKKDTIVLFSDDNSVHRREVFIKK